MMDQQTASFLRSKLAGPSQGDLVDLLKRTNRVKVSELVFRDRTGTFEPVFELTSAEDLAGFSTVLHVRPESRGHLMSAESHRIQCFSGEHDLATLYLVGTRILRWPARWRSDAVLSAPDALADFFLAQGCPTLRTSLDQAREKAAKLLVDDATWKRTWEAAIPAGLLPLVGQLEHDSFAPISAARDRAMQALACEFPEPELQALALLRWYGHSLGRWSGFPSSEKVPELLLEMIPHEVLIAALRRDDLTVQQKEGAARFLCWISWKLRSKKVPEIPGDIRKRLWAYVESTKDQDKIERASRVLRGGGRE